jgi:ketosteroid isomerase-like protein
MEDVVSIQQILNQYSVASSRSDIEAIISTYAEDGVWSLRGGSLLFEGTDAIRQGLSSFVDRLEYMVQFNSPAVIVVAGDTATATSVIVERGRYRETGEVFEALGFYDDSLVKGSDGWRFKQRTSRTEAMRTIEPARL